MLRKSTLWVLALLASWNVIPGNAATLHREPKKITIRGRILAQAPKLPMTSLGMNRDVYVFVIDSGKGPQYIKLAYDFLLYEPQIPDDLFDYTKLLRFSAVREKSCDEPMARLGGVGKNSSLQYAAGAPSLAGGDTILPCYVVTPHDYRGARAQPLAGRHSTP